MAGPDLHIIAFAVPYPPTYGGAIDVWNRVKALHRQGLKIHLHCFVYGSFSPHNALREVADEVYYYPRIPWPALLSPGLPYIVSSRRNPLLLSRLSQDNVPVLFEGIHTTGFFHDLQNRRRLLRSHNIEHHYYNDLAKDAKRFQYLFFQREALALQRYEFNYAKEFDKVFSISVNDTAWYSEHGARSTFMPVYHGFEKTVIREGRGSYLLYQGDLSIEANQLAVTDLMKKLPRDLNYPIIVAGRKGDFTFEEKLTKYTNLSREVDVSENRMTELLNDAQIIIVHSRYSSGMKVKLFPALYHGRYVIANENSLTKTPYDGALTTYRSVDELVEVIRQLWERPFSSNEMNERNRILAGMPSDDDKAKEIISNL